MILSTYRLKISYTYHVTYSLYNCLHLIKIIMDLKQSFRHKRLWTQRLSIKVPQTKLHADLVEGGGNATGREGGGREEEEG